MKTLDRRKALWIELGVVLLWRVVPIIHSQLTLYRPAVEASREAQRVSSVLSSLGIISVMALIIWQSGDSFESFGIVKDKVWRVVAITFGVLFLHLAVTHFMTPSASVLKISADGLARHSPGSWIALGAVSLIAATRMQLVFTAYFVTRLEELFGGTEWAIVGALAIGCLTSVYAGVWSIVLSGTTTLIYCFIFSRTRSLLPLILAQALFVVCGQMVWASLRR